MSRYRIRYRNSFLPQIRGRIAATPTGTRVRVTMLLHPAVAGFMVLWFGGVGAGVMSLLHTHAWSPAALFPVGMLAFGVALVGGGFHPEAIKARRLLQRAIAGTNVPDPSAVQSSNARQGWI